MKVSRIRRTLFLVTGILAGYTTIALFPSTPAPQPEKLAIGKGDAGNLRAAYQRWAADYDQGEDTALSIGLTWNQGLSNEFSEGRGIARINLTRGIIDVLAEQINDPEISDVWLIDRENSVAINRIKVGALKNNNSIATLHATLDANQLSTFRISQIVITRNGTTPDSGTVLAGTTSLFQRMYHYPAVMTETLAEGARSAAWSRFNPGIARANGITPAHYPDAALINEGRRLFFEETFDGNGRTCGTCHPANNNFTIDPKFIATLPDDDPLFVAERPEPNPLSEHFEHPELMRKAGLINVNSNGFDDLENSFTLRSVPHISAIRTSVSPPTASANDGTTTPPDHRTGWSGDGSPTDLSVSPQQRGTLRDFAIGAVRQHFPKTLARQFGSDFRMPTEHELDAIEAFMLSIGRQEEFDDFSQIQMADERADRGRLNYMGVNLANGVPCNACHLNGGANTDPNFDFPAAITPPAFEQTNRSFAPRAEELIDQPGDVIGGAARNPFDDGFGAGTNLFNVPTVIEAADTGPFFHGNQIDTVEGMISFYATQRHLRNGEVLAPIVGLNGSQVANVGAFLRVLNADDNAKTAGDLVLRAQQLYRYKDRRTNLKLARAEIEDAIEVLEGGHLHFDNAVPLFNKADRYVRSGRLNKAKIALKQARDSMIIR